MKEKDEDKQKHAIVILNEVSILYYIIKEWWECIRIGWTKLVQTKVEMSALCCCSVAYTNLHMFAILSSTLSETSWKPLFDRVSFVTSAFLKTKYRVCLIWE